MPTLGSNEKAGNPELKPLSVQMTELTQVPQNSVEPGAQPSQREKFEKDYLFPPIKSKFRNIFLPDNVLLLLIQYVGMISCVKFQHLSRNWFTRIQTLFNNMSEPMEGQFQEAYADYFNLIDTKLIITPT